MSFYSKHSPTPHFTHTRTANATISKGVALKLSSGKYDVAGVGDNGVAIALEDAASGAQATASHLGFCLALVDGSGSAIAEGDFLIPTTAGKLIKATGNVRGIAYACDASTASGDLIGVFILPCPVGTATA